jgi:putative transposase
LVKEKEISYSQACRIAGCSRNRKYYQKKMPVKDAPVKEAIEEICKNSRKGRMKVIKMVQKKHPQFGSSRIRRVYEQYGFVLNRKTRLRVVNNPVNPILMPLALNEEWAVDFMSDALQNGQKIRCLNVIEHYNRQCLSITIAHNIAARRVIERLERAIEEHGKPQRIRSDNGPEFISRRFQTWLKDKGISWSRIPKASPDQNAIIERFNRSYREEVLDAYLFKTISEAQRITDKWKEHYNNERPHQSLNYKTPAEYAAA